MTRDATTPIQRFEYSTCPRCSKRAYGSKAAARAAKKELNDRALHLYRCEQGNLHLGHMAPGATREVYRRDVDYYRAMAAEARTAAASYRAQAAATQPTRDPADLERDAQAADLDATRWDALAAELDALEPAGGPVGQEPML